MGAQTVYAIGECMIELQKSGEGSTMDYRFGGDTLTRPSTWRACSIPPPRRWRM